MLDAVYNGKPGDTGTVDDMIITGKSEEEHDHNFLQIARSNHLRLNGEKLQFKQEALFFGHNGSTDGLGPDPNKIQLIFQMQMHEDKETMKSLLGMLNFLGRLSSKFSELLVPLRKINDVRGPYKQYSISR